MVGGVDNSRYLTRGTCCLDHSRFFRCLVRMARMVFCAVLVALLSGVHFSEAQVQQGGPCPVLRSVANFDITKFMGAWYEVMQTRRPDGKSIECVRYYFQQISDANFSLHAYSRSSQQSKLFTVTEGLAETVQQENGNYAIHVTYDGKENMVMLLDTDYKSFAVLWSCLPSESSHYESTVVLSRIPNPSLDVLYAARDVLEVNNLTLSYLVTVSQRDCPRITIPSTKGTSPAATVTPANTSPLPSQSSSVWPTTMPTPEPSPSSSTGTVTPEPSPSSSMGTATPEPSSSGSHGTTTPEPSPTGPTGTSTPEPSSSGTSTPEPSPSGSMGTTTPGSSPSGSMGTTTPGSSPSGSMGTSTPEPSPSGSVITSTPGVSSSGSMGTSTPSKLTTSGNTTSGSTIKPSVTTLPQTKALAHRDTAFILSVLSYCIVLQILG